MRTWKLEEVHIRDSVTRSFQTVQKKKVQIWLSVLFLFCSFFLSQAVLFEAAVPFFLPIWAITVARYPRYALWTLAGGLLGGVTLGFGQTVIQILEILIFAFISQITMIKLPKAAIVGISVLSVQVVWQSISYGGEVPLAVWLFVGYESVLSVIMTIFLFLLFLPLHDLLRTRWTFERMGAALVVGAVILTGMQELMISFVSIPRIFLHLAILVAAAVGGITISTAVAVMAGAIISISQLSYSGMMAVYALIGLCAGICSRGGKGWIVFGGTMAVLFFSLYDTTLPLDTTYFSSIVVASIIFFLFPKQWIGYWQKQLFPNRDEVLLQRQQWLTENMSSKLVEFHHFVDFMKELVNDRFSVEQEREKTILEDPLPPCVSCFQYDKCWGKRGEGMEQVILQWVDARASSKVAQKHRLNEKIKYKCVRSVKLLDALEERVSRQQLNGHYYHGKKMIALQLRDMCNHLDVVMSEMKENTVSFRREEEELSKELKAVGIEHFQIDILSNEIGSRKIVCCLPEKKVDWETEQLVAERLILPILQKIFDEPFEISRSKVNDTPYPHVQITFQSAVRFQLEYDVFTTSKKSTIYSGDAHAVFPLHNGLTAIMLSDGMGQSKQAHQESRRLIRLMRECMNHKMAPETAMHTLHYVMSLKKEEDMYATVDFALMDLQEGTLWSWKAGSMATYIVRGTQLIRLESASVPVGFLSSFSVDADKVQLKAGDFIFMLTDGLFFNDESLEEQEETLVKLLIQMENAKMEEICSTILRAFRGSDQLDDDCTLIAIRVLHKVVDWSLFRPSSSDISRERMIK